MEQPIEEDYLSNTKWKIGKYTVDDGENVIAVKGYSIEEAIEEYMYSKSPSASNVPIAQQRVFNSTGKIKQSTPNGAAVGPVAGYYLPPSPQDPQDVTSSPKQP
jgi:hypothetical protein